MPKFTLVLVCAIKSIWYLCFFSFCMKRRSSMIIFTCFVCGKCILLAFVFSFISLQPQSVFVEKTSKTWAISTFSKLTIFFRVKCAHNFLFSLWKGPKKSGHYTVKGYFETVPGWLVFETKNFFFMEFKKILEVVWMILHIK